jgi:hypothetical protein
VSKPDISTELLRRINDANGTLRHFAATQHFGRFRIEADIDQ